MRDPLIPAAMDERPLVLGGRQPCPRAGVLAGAARLAAALPPGGPLINLCAGRGAFLQGFLAGLFSGRGTLLPPNRQLGTVERLLGSYPDAVLLHDGAPLPLSGPAVQVAFPLSRPISGGEAAFPPRWPDGERVVATLFTSGSTGEPTPHAKTWRSLHVGAHLAARRFGWSPTTAIVATVPPQHMYGFETSILVPLVMGAAVHEARPLFPQDVADALWSVTLPDRVLVTTPLHLKALLAAGCAWPAMTSIVSATAPLMPELAAAVERAFRAPVFEIYGCTEGGSLASRRTIGDETWAPYDGVRLVRAGEAPLVVGGHLAEPAALADIVDEAADGRFRLLGRHVDHVSVAGKRASLGELNAKLLAIPGVEDGAFIAPPSLDGAKVERVAACFVSRSLSAAELWARLACEIDPVFMPRPLRRVSALPRNELGKLARAELLAVLAGQGGEGEHQTP